ncbi:hypothetical protein DWB79_11775 [Treponema medium]|uniref:Polymorphic outer membrane protein n=2 Tax=Treponema medium TaxID=58231 RepID=A0AA87NPX1_TREMD|nr:right-handed parallel beta-helix repeat-containing protein [Treponema medium]EPF27817.1 hypothetical protein HMPREF9195_02318 [Treponema medium ATCC 700293]QSH98408.1 hypothetical protein DWB79_11775 [Treponema medium]
MRKAFIILTGILFTLLFATCKQFTADIDDYLSRWSTEAFILSSTIDKKTYNDGSSIPSVASANDVTVTLKVQNHKSFQFIMPSASETRNIVEFAHFAGTKPAVSADYELKQLTADTLQLVYKADFLKNSEWGEKDVSSTITLYADDGRPPFKQTFTVPLKANTPPPLPTFTVAKTTDSPAYYVLCIKVPDMDKTVPGGLLHKDLARIEVNGAPYMFSVNEAQTAFTKPEADVFITHSDVEKLNEPDADDVPADSSWVLYYKTDVEVKDGAAKKDYTIKLIDEKGLVSGIVNASTKPNKAETEIVTITKGTKISGSGSESDPAIIGTDSTGAVLSVSSATANTTVHCTVSEIGGSTPVKYDGNPVDVPLPLNGLGEKKYKLEYYTDGEGFVATPVQTVYYKVVKRHTVTFNVVGGNGSLEGKYGSDQQTATTSPVTLTVPHGYSVTFTATPADSTHYKVGDWTCTPSEGFTGASGNPTATLTVTADTTVSVQFVQLNALTLSRLEIHGKDASAGSVTLPYTVTQVKKEDISLAFSGQTGINFTISPQLLNLTEGIPQSITINVAASQGNYPAWSKTVSITRAKNNVAKLRSFTLNGETKTAASDGSFASEYEVASDKAEVKGFSFADGSTGATASVSPEGKVSIPEDTGKTFTITVKAQDGTQSTVEFTVKRKKYKVDYSVEIVDGKAGGTIAAGTNGQTTDSTVSVTHGGSVTFTGRPATGDWKVAGWTVSSGSFESNPGTSTTATLSNVTEAKTVTVKFYQSTLKNPATWKDLARAVKSAPDNATLTINGQIQATDVANDVSRIKVQKNLTIKGENNAVLNALGKKGIFDAYKTLTLQDITLTNSTLSGSYSGGAGVYVNPSGTLIMEGSSVITDCSAANSGGGVYVGGGTFEMHGTSAITGCTASKGGGVYVSGGTFKMQDSAIVTPSTSGDTDKPGKNDVYLEDGKTITVDSILSNAHAARITPELYKKQTVLKAGSGVTLKYEVGKFTVTPDGSDTWKIDSEGKLTLYEATIKGSPSSNDAWKKLKQAVANASDGSTITIDGEIKATNDAENNGEIVINKNLTIKRATGASSAVIDANKDTGSKPKHRIFKVESGKTLTLKNLTLKNGMAEGPDGPGDGGAIYVHGASVNITNCTLTNHTANKNGGAVYATKRDNNAARVTISGGFINGNMVTINSGFGGGIYINDGCKLTLTGGVEVNNNKAARGGGVRANNSDVIMNGCTFEGNKSTHGDASDGCGGVYVNGGTVSMKNCILKNNDGNVRAGGLLIEGGATVTMKDCTLTGNTATTGGGIYITGGSSIVTLNNGVQIKDDNTATTGGGVYVQDGTFKMSGSAVVTPATGSEANSKGKNDVYLKSGQAITVDGTLSNNPAARITPESYTEEQQVLNGSEVGSEYYKFEVTPESSTAEWVIKSDGCLKKAKDVVSSSSATPWKDLKTAITSAHDGDIIVINGEIKATDAPDNYGGITINKSITIKGKNKDTAILNANKNENGKFPHYIFFVNGGKTVTLQNLTLTGGINGKGGAIHIGASTHGSTVKMINCIIKDNAATGDGGGGVYIGSNGTFTMDGESSSITRNFVNGTGTGFAVYIDDEGTFNWIKGSISNNGGSDKAVHKEPDGEFNNPENYTAY